MKNLFRFSIVSSFILLSFLFSQNISAATATPQPELKGMVVAEVNIKNAKIVFQDGQTYKVSFSVENGTGLQSGVKYGIELYSDTGQYLADQKVFDESLTLHEHTTITRELTYTAPAGLSGNYTMMLDMKNESNFPFSHYIVGKIKLSGTAKGVQIAPSSCFLSIKEDKTATHYTLTQNLQVTSDQSLMLNCSATNTSATSATVLPLFETRSFGSFGSIASEEQPNQEATTVAIAFAKGEKKTISILVPKADIARAYNVKASLSDGTTTSNSVFFSYVLGGQPSATIQSLTIDKDSYKAGDTATLSLIWYGAGMTSTDGLTAKTTIVNTKGWECADPNTQPLIKTADSPITTLSVPIKSPCENPDVKLAIVDGNGKTLDQREFTFASATTTPAVVPAPVSKKYLLLGVIALLVIAGVAIYSARRKKIYTTNAKM